METISMISIVSLLAPAIYQLGLTLGIGSSTFALIFYIQFLSDGEMDPTERRVLKTVFFVLRLGMAFIISGLLFFFVLEQASGRSLLNDVGFLIQATIMGVIVGNAVLMTLHYMPMWLGPVLAGGSWYALFLIRFVPFSSPSYWFLLMAYGAFVCIFFVAFTYIKGLYTPKKETLKEQVPEVSAVVTPEVTDPK